MSEIEINRDYEVCLAWKSRTGKNAVSSFEVHFIKALPQKPDGIVVKVNKFIDGGITNHVKRVEDLPELMKKEVLALIGEKIEIYKESLFDYEANWIRNPLS